MERIEKSINIENIFEGKVIRVERHQVALLQPQDVDKMDAAVERVSVRELVHHPGGVCVVAVNDKHEICLVKQYRKAVENFLWEIPAGKREKGEDPLLTAQRELREETGFTAEKWVFLGEMYATPGYCDEVIFMYMATDLQAGEQHLDEGEFLSVHWLPWQEVRRKVMENHLLDGKTKLAFLLATERMQQVQMQSGDQNGENE